jgi:excinuclease ABC subunit A
MAEPDAIRIRGAREHNLRAVDLDIPRNALVVFTGVSGSGKSSLAFDTIYKEGQRRFMESLSAYARQFLGQMERPKVELLDGVSPTLCIDQKTVNRNPRSTVGTVTEIWDHLRLMMARLGTPHCPRCATPITRVGVDQVVDEILERGGGKKVHVLAPIVRERKGEYRKELDELRRDGWVRVRVDGEIKGLDETFELARYEKHTIEVVVDRLVPQPNDRARIGEAVETAIRTSGDHTVVALIDDQEVVFSTSRGCPKHPDVSIPELEPRLFSFNAPQGACQACGGLGLIASFDPGRIVDLDAAASSCYNAFNEDGRVPFSYFDKAALLQIIKLLGGDPKAKVRDWPPDRRDKLLFGDATLSYQTQIDRGDGRVEVRERPWAGLVGLVTSLWGWTQYPGFEKFRAERPCETCNGTRLNEIARAVTFRGQAITHYARMSVVEAHGFFDGLELEAEEKEIGAAIVQEVRDRLQFLHEVGLDYLTLDRSAATLSGGEAQRIRLAAAVGSALQGVTYVLDEPSIGLHPRDNKRLLQALFRLRDRGNSVIVVEHDAETIAVADHVVDVGPGAGSEGGQIVASGTPEALVRGEGLTAAWMRGERHIPLPEKRRKSKQKLVVRNARENNLKGVDVAIPLGVFVVVTGVSGSGKSTLIFDVLEASLHADFEGRRPAIGCDDVQGVDQIDKVVTISQSPIGRTPRSNPATYTSALDIIRDLFAANPEAQARGYKKGRFSFNVAGGRCEVCEGAGVRTVEMQFLPDVEVPCDACEGRRFNAETLEITWSGKNIHDVLEMQIAEANEFFKNIPKLRRILDTLVSVGLGYVTLGQPATTLSGGEAQRLKLASELYRPATGKTLYLLDEPTTGLHFEDVKRLLDALDRLVQAGNSVVVVEHHTDVIKCADHVVDLGPEGGDGGGVVVGEGTPEKIAKLPTPTGRSLAALVELGGPGFALESGRPAILHPRLRPRELIVEGARKHNLQGVDVRIPHGKMTVITGPSGSGKTSLAFDTIFTEGQRRYVESLSTYARRFLGRLERAPVDRLEGLAPAIAIDQIASSHNPRSTVATVTEIHDVLRLLYARIGEPFCPHCDAPVEGFAPSLGAAKLRKEAKGAGWVLARLSGSEAAEERRKSLLREGWTRILDREGAEVELADEAATALIGEGCALVIDRFDPSRTPTSRTSEALTSAQKLSGGVAWFRMREGGQTWRLSLRPSCPTHGEVLPLEITPRHFSFNSRIGACPDCDGIGTVRAVVPEKVLPEPENGFWRALDPRIASVLTRSARQRTLIGEVLTHLGTGVDKPVSSWTKAQRKAVLHGLPEPFTLKWTKQWGKVKQSVEEKREWPGLLPLLDSWNSRLDWLVAETTCPTCEGGRLRPELLSIRLGGLGIHQFSTLTVSDALAACEGWTLDVERTAIAERPRSEMVRRLRFLVDVGLGYLALDRPAETLSGGEAQRIRLASQLGTSLTGVIYVLDEPTIGLHPRDTERLVTTLEGLRDLGNTVIVVEHDVETIGRADNVVDLGPGAGREGGRILATGTPSELAANERSITGRWLSGRESMPVPAKRRKARAKIVVKAPSGNNLRCGDVTFPTGVWVAVSGVSGSGKSTLVMDTLAPALIKHIGEASSPSPHKGLTVGETVDRVVVVDQQPIGRTPRSTPATYTGVMDGLRQVFAGTAGAQERGWDAGRFSFNAPGGRCEVCEGRGATLVEMHFLPDVWVTCSNCNGKRYGRETLAVRWMGHSIADVLAMRIDEVLTLFQNHRGLARQLQALVDVGLGYISLGQPATTLSGGEAQRVKLATELGSRRGHCVYVLDEPTTGLHLSDVAKLVQVLHRLVDQGHTVVTIEHHLDMLAQADHLIDLGPEAGAGGGEVVGVGTPEQVAKADTPTGRALARHLAAVTPAKKQRSRR